MAQEIIIDAEFRDLIPPLDEETYRWLEANLFEHGCRDALVTWGGLLIDGHNRYEICKKHDIPFTVVEKSFAVREEALIWIISTQVARRNLNSIQLSHFRGLHYKAEKALITNKKGKNQYSEVEAQKEPQPLSESTAEKLARHYKVSVNTIKRDSNVAEGVESIGHVSSEAKRKILSGDIRINKTKLQELQFREADEINELAAAIESGTYEKRTANPETPNELSEPAHIILSGAKALNLASGSGDKPEFRTALRAYIDMLEELYRNLILTL